MSDPAARQAEFIQLGCERKAGQFLAGTEKNPGRGERGNDGRLNQRAHNVTAGPPKLADLGVTKMDPTPGPTALPTSCGHHQRNLLRLAGDLGGRIIPSAAVTAGCSFADVEFSGGAPCGCLTDWIALPGGLLREIGQRFGRVPRETVDEAVRLAMAHGRDVVEVLALAEDLRSDRRFCRGWAEALALVQSGSTLALLASRRAGPRLALSRRAKRAHRRAPADRRAVSSGSGEPHMPPGSGGGT